MHMIQITINVVTMGIVLGDGHSEKFGYNKGCAVGNACVYKGNVKNEEATNLRSIYTGPTGLCAVELKSNYKRTIN